MWAHLLEGCGRTLEIACAAHRTAGTPAWVCTHTYLEWKHEDWYKWGMNGPVRVQNHLKEQIAEKRIYRCHLYQQVINTPAHADSQGFQNGKTKGKLQNQAMKRR